MDNLNILPVKFLYNDKKNQIKIFYRQKNSIDLFEMVKPYSHYVFLENPNGEYYSIVDKTKRYNKKFLSLEELSYHKKEHCIRLAEGDLKPEQRYIYDTYSDKNWPNDIPVRIFCLDIEVYSTEGLLPNWQHHKYPINGITIYDSYTKMYECFFLIPNSEWNLELKNESLIKKMERISIRENIPFEIDNINVHLYCDEKELMNDVLSYWNENFPDIVTGWNTSFDIPYIVRKIYDYFNLNGVRRLSPFKKLSFRVIKGVEEGLIVEDDNIIPGIDVIDYKLLFEKFNDTELSSYSLDNVSQEVLKRGKLKYNGNLIQLYKEDFDRFCLYNYSDVELVNALDSIKKFMVLTTSVRNISLTNFSDIFEMSHVVDGCFLRKIVCKRKNDEKIVLPSKKSRSEKKKFCGAYVKEPLKGRWKIITDLDYTSLYPSLIRTFNLSPETIIGMVENYTHLNEMTVISKFGFYYDKTYLFPESEFLTPPESLKKDGIYINFIESNETMKMSYKDFVKLCHEKNYSVLPNGLITTHNIEMPLMVEIVTEIGKGRTIYKELKKEMLNKKDYEKASGYDTLQNAMKIIGNSTYGVISMNEFRLFDVRIAEAITTSGQFVIKSSSILLNNYINKKFGFEETVDHIITIDTDSMIFTLEKIFPNFDINNYNDDDIDKINHFVKECEIFINKSSKKIPFIMFHKKSSKDNYLSVKQEWIGISGLFTSKKHYVLHIVRKEGLKVDEIYGKGIAIRRSDVPKPTKEFLSSIINKLLNFENKSEIKKRIMEEVKNIDEVYSLGDLGLPVGMKRPDQYEKTLPIHIRGANIFNKYISRNEADQLQFGKIKYIYVKNWKTLNQLNINISDYNVVSWNPDSDYESEIEKLIEIDRMKMKERMIIKIIDPFFKSMNWSIPEEIMATTSLRLNIFKKKKVGSVDE
jgi:DNA polymerase elongation subunit (family B)